MLTKNEKARLKLIEDKKKLNEMAEPWFEDWMKKNVKEEPFAVTENKTQNLQVLVKELLAGNLNKPYAFAQKVLKTYYPKRKMEISEFVNYADLKITKPVELIGKFINDFIVEDEEFEFQSTLGLNSQIQTLVAKKMKEVFGSVIYLDLSKYGFKFTKDTFGSSALIDAFEDLGYVKFGGLSAFFIGKENQEPTSDLKDCQDWLFEMYKEVTEKYVVNFPTHLSKKMSVKSFDELGGVVKSCLDNIEKRLSYKMLHSIEFKACKSVVDKFFKEGINSYRKFYTREGRSGEYKLLVEASLNRLAKQNATEEDKQVVKGFYAHLSRVYRGMTNVDENGKSYPENYFALTSIMPRDMLILMDKF